MKLFKRMMSVMLAGVLAVGMLAGCGGSNGGNVNDPVPAGPRPEDPDVLAVYEVIEQKAAKMQFTSAPAYSEEASKLAEAYLNGGDKTAAFNELKAALAEQGLRVSNAQDTAEVSSVGSLRYSNGVVWTSDLETTNFSMNKRYTDMMVAGLVDYRCNSVGIAAKDGQMAIVYLRITEVPAENN